MGGEFFNKFIVYILMNDDFVDNYVDLFLMNKFFENCGVYSMIDICVWKDGKWVVVVEFKGYLFKVMFGDFIDMVFDCGWFCKVD